MTEILHLYVSTPLLHQIDHYSGIIATKIAHIRTHQRFNLNEEYDRIMGLSAVIYTLLRRDLQD